MPVRRIGVLFVIVVALLVAALGVSASTIHQASAKGDILLVKTLIKNTPSLVSEPDERDVTPLHLACFYGQRTVVLFLISAGAPIDAVTKSGYTPLLWAVWRKHTPVVKILLSKGADVNAKSASGMTPIHFAVQNGDKGMVALLLDKGADVSAKDSLGQTAVDMARAGKVASLIALFPKASTSSNPGNDTAKNVVSKQTLPEVKVAVKPEVKPIPAPKPILKETIVTIHPIPNPKVVLSKPVKVTKAPKPVIPKPTVHHIKPAPKVALTRSVILAVMAAARLGKTEALQSILDRQPALKSAVDRNGATLMHWLAEADWPEGIQLFAKAGGDVNAPKKDGVTPLQVAAALGKIQALDTLMEMGARPDLEDSKGRTALSLARDRGQEEASDILLKKP